MSGKRQMSNTNRRQIVDFLSEQKEKCMNLQIWRICAANLQFLIITLTDSFKLEQIKDKMDGHTLGKILDKNPGYCHYFFSSSFWLLEDYFDWRQKKTKLIIAGSLDRAGTKHWKKIIIDEKLVWTFAAALRHETIQMPFYPHSHIFFWICTRK